MYVIGKLIYIGRANNTESYLHALPLVEKARILRLAAFIRLQQKKSGSIPASLNEIEVPEQKMLLDSFSEQPFRYIAASDCVTIYSIGPDLKNNQGIERNEISESDVAIVLLR